jgi:hypothetical protein
MPAEKVLIVDERSRSVGRSAKCGGWGYHVLEADNGSAALRVVHNESPDLVLFDARLPDASGHGRGTPLPFRPYLTNREFRSRQALYQQSKPLMTRLTTRVANFATEFWFVDMTTSTSCRNRHCDGLLSRAGVLDVRPSSSNYSHRLARCIQVIGH